MNMLSRLTKSFIHWLLTPALLPSRPLTGRSLRAAQILAGTVAAASAVMFLVILPARFAWLQRLVSQVVSFLHLGTTNPGLFELLTRVFPPLALGIEISVMTLYLINSGLLFWKRAHDWQALLTAAALPTFALHIIPTMITWMNLSPLNMLVGNIFKCFGLGLAFLFLWLFPQGTYAPSWMRLFFLGWIAWSIAWLLNPRSIFDFRDPYSMNIPTFLVFVGWWGVGILSQIYRFYRVSGPLEKQQTKIITLGAAGNLVGYMIYVPLRQLFLYSNTPQASSMVFLMIAPYIYLLLIAAIPVLITISIMRYHLWDINIIIRRTLAYTLLSGLLTVVYFAGVGLTQNRITAMPVMRHADRGLQIASQSTPQEPPILVVAATTLALAVLFNPVRRWVQAFIDRRFFRQTYDTDKALAQFAAVARSETNLDQLTRELKSVVEKTLQPRTLSLWLADLRKPQGEDTE